MISAFMSCGLCLEYKRKSGKRLIFHFSASNSYSSPSNYASQRTIFSLYALQGRDSVTVCLYRDWHSGAWSLTEISGCFLLNIINNIIHCPSSPLSICTLEEGKKCPVFPVLLVTADSLFIYLFAQRKLSCWKVGKNVTLIFLMGGGYFWGKNCKTKLGLLLFFKKGRSCFKEQSQPFKVIICKAGEGLAWSPQSVAIVNKITDVSPSVLGWRGFGSNIWWTLFHPFYIPIHAGGFWSAHNLKDRPSSGEGLAQSHPLVPGPTQPHLWHFDLLILLFPVLAPL